jgi:ARG and Rhodanese-Phosphatase-superfamily-associated Protein domain
VSNAHLRRLKAEAQAAQPMARGVAQSVVWNEVHERLDAMLVDSPTGASSDLYRSRERELRALEDAFPAQPGQCGAILALGTDMCVDVVSRPDAFARLWPKLRAGYLLDALGHLDRKPVSPTVLPAILTWVSEAEHARQPSVGLGEDVRVRGEHVIGSGLELGGELLQLSAFTSRQGGRRAFGRIARPSARR